MLDEKQLEEILREVRDRSGVPSIGASICSTHGSLSAAVGVRSTSTGAPLTVDSEFDVSCLMKFFISIVTLETVAAGRLQLDQPIASVLSEFSGTEGSRGERISIRHLLGHSSGYRGMDITNSRVRWNATWSDIVRWTLDSPLLFDVGQMFSYEHSEHVILGKVLERVTNKHPAHLVTETIFDPLGVKVANVPTPQAANPVYANNHSYAPIANSYGPIAFPPPCPTWSASLPDTTISLFDMARIARSLITAGPQSVFSAFTRANLEISHKKIPIQVSSDGRAERIPISFGLLCGRYGGDVFGHNGSSVGQTCAVRFSPALDLSVAVGTNCWAPSVRDEVVRRIFSAVTSETNAQMDEAGFHSFPTETVFGGFSPCELAGRYLGGFQSQIDVRNEGGDVICEVGKSRKGFRIVERGDGNCVIECATPLSVAFLRVEKEEQPALFLGVHGYRRFQESSGERLGE